MLINSLTTVFIHVPKTAGNYVQHFLISLGLTSETIETHAHHDGFHRFAIVGEYTSNKHQNLVDYQKRFNRKQWRSLSFLSIWRDPRERLISLYLSPHRYANSRGVVVAPQHYDLDDFEQVVKTYPSTTQKLRTRNRRLPRALTLLSFGNVKRDLEQFLDSKGYDLSAPVERRNPTTSRTLFNQMMEDDRIHRMVKRSHHWDDFNLLNK